MDRSLSGGQLSHLSPGQRLILPLVVGLFGGLFFFWTLAMATDLTSSWFNGRATLPQIRRALILGAIPRSLTLPFMVLFALIVGDAYFDDEYLERIAWSETLVVSILLITICTLTIWSIVSTSHTLAEVQGFRSAWKGCLQYVVGLLCWLLVLVLLGVLWILLRKQL